MATEPMFTPGPWCAGIEGNNRVYGPDCSGENSGLIAVVYKGRGNINLITAAPELYEAVGLLLTSYQAAVLNTSASDNTHVAFAEAALRKARGLSDLRVDAK